MNRRPNGWGAPRADVNVRNAVHRLARRRFPRWRMPARHGGPVQTVANVLATSHRDDDLHRTVTNQNLTVTPATALMPGIGL